MAYTVKNISNEQQSLKEESFNIDQSKDVVACDSVKTVEGTAELVSKIGAGSFKCYNDGIEMPLNESCDIISFANFMNQGVTNIRNRKLIKEWDLHNGY